MNRKAKAMEFIDEQYTVNITGRHLEVTDAMKQYALEKVSKIEKLSSRIIDVNVIMDIQKLEHRVEIILKVNQTTIRSLACTQDMYASVDLAVSKIESQLRRYKTKLQNHQAKPLAIIDMNVNVLKRPQENEDDSDEVEFDFTDQNYHQKAIVSKETRPLKTLTLDEAVMKMELSNDSFLIFKNEIDKKLRVIYRRNDGDYGVIEPEA